LRLPEISGFLRKPSGLSWPKPAARQQLARNLSHSKEVNIKKIHRKPNTLRLFLAALRKSHFSHSLSDCNQTSNGAGQAESFANLFLALRPGRFAKSLERPPSTKTAETRAFPSIKQNHSPLTVSQTATPGFATPAMKLGRPQGSPPSNRPTR